MNQQTFSSALLGVLMILYGVTAWWWIGLDDFILGPVNITHEVLLPDEVKRGETLVYYASFTRRRACPSEWTYSLIDGVSYHLLTKNAGSLVPRDGEVELGFIVPQYIKPGKYRLGVTARHLCNPMRAKVEEEISDNSVVIR